MPSWALLLLACMLAFAGCGGTDLAAPGPASPERDGSGAASRDEGSSEDAAGPSPEAVKARRQLDRLVAAYAPVSARVNFLVAAETLRTDAVESGAGNAIELERSGAVRIEAVKLRRVLEAARPRVAAAEASAEGVRQVRARMLAALDSRMRSLSQLSLALDAVSNPAIGDTVVDQRFDLWRASWDAALLAARDATTIMQDTRGELGLDPAPEESIR